MGRFYDCKTKIWQRDVDRICKFSRTVVNRMLPFFRHSDGSKLVPFRIASEMALGTMYLQLNRIRSGHTFGQVVNLLLKCAMKVSEKGRILSLKRHIHSKSIPCSAIQPPLSDGASPCMASCNSPMEINEGLIPSRTFFYLALVGSETLDPKPATAADSTSPHTINPTYRPCR